MKVEIRPSYAGICRDVAQRIALLIRQKPDAVLGLATGTTPIGVYDELIRLHREEGLSFAKVRTFNLDEYYPLSPDAPQSYKLFMHEKLFDHIDIAPQNCHIPDGSTRPLEAVVRDCDTYERAIQNAGGLDFQILGIGRTGHIGFNEPGSAQETRTRLVVLDHLTRSDAAGDFYGLENVPARAITMGVGTILEAREIAVIASGQRKAKIAAEALEGKITSKVPASFLREHDNTTFWLDEAAAGELKSPDAPVASKFDELELQRRDLIAIALQRGKTLAEITPDSEIEAQMLERLSDSLLPSGQNILCLSPHPDDDVICCGATLLKMAAPERSNRLFVAYGVNGANAVRDKDVLAALRARHPRLITYLEENLEPGKSLETAFAEVRESIFEREPGKPDAPLMRELKRLIRESEAADGCRKMSAKAIFLDLPFYGDGAHRQPVGSEDVQRCLVLLREVQPDTVLMTGELNDPHGTHEMCQRAFESAAEIYFAEGGKPFVRWKYRGAWDEWPLEEGSYLSVFDKDLMEKKIDLILDHVSQLDPLFPGAQTKEFWERARDRNRQTARDLQTLGLLPPSRSFAPLYAEVYRFEVD